MINERHEVQEYLSGKNINKACVYRICYLMAKWHKEQGLSNMEIRDAIFAWANDNGLYLEFNVNNLIITALSDGRMLRGDIKVYISKNDIDEIRRRFDGKNTRMLALAILSYAKACADSRGEFDISLLALSNWINIAQSNISGRYLKELIDFEYVSKLETKRKWKKSSKSTLTKLRINVPLINKDGDLIVDNNIASIFHKHF